MKKIDSDIVDNFGISINRLFLSSLHSLIQKSIETHQKLAITYLNFHTVNIIKTNQTYIAMFQSFDIVIPDGKLIIKALSFFGQKFNIDNGISAEFILPRIFNNDANKMNSIYLLGGSEYQIQQASNNLKKQYKNIEIVGFHHGYLVADADSQEVISDINQSNAKILIIGMGQPKQEEWIRENKNKINTLIIIAVGGYLDKICLNVYAYPTWVYRYRLFWLYRLIKEPRQLWKRYTIGVAIFGWHVLLEKLRK